VTEHHRVSVVTVSYNQGRFLGQALESVIRQDYRDVEHIVVDAGSTDKSHEILDRYASQISRIIIESDRGPADGLNKGFSKASGDIFVCLNADDELLPGALTNAVEVLVSDPLADVVHAHTLIVTADGALLRPFRSNRFNLVRYVNGGINLPHQSTVFRAKAYHDVSGFNPDNRTCWDAEFAVDMALAGERFRRVNDFWSVFRLHAESISGSRRFATTYASDQRRIRAKVSPPAPAVIQRAREMRARMEKFIFDPVYLMWRVKDELSAWSRQKRTAGFFIYPSAG
jgi:glycosyltransferase involved in cell wall biosynthesis